MSEALTGRNKCRKPSEILTDTYSIAYTCTYVGNVIEIHVNTATKVFILHTKKSQNDAM